MFILYKNFKSNGMLTSIEIALLLKKQQKNKKQKPKFDTALIGLGITQKNSKEQEPVK